MSTVEVEFKEESEKSIKTREYLEENKDLAVSAKWFTNPASLSDYKRDYLRYLSKRRGGKRISGNVQSHVADVVNGFKNVDCITIHAVADLIERSDSQCCIFLKNINEHEWLEVMGGTIRAPVFSKMKIINAVKIEKKLHNQSYSYLQAAMILDVPFATLKTYLNTPDRGAAYLDLQPLIYMTMFKERRVSKQKVEAHIANRVKPL